MQITLKRPMFKYMGLPIGKISITLLIVTIIAVSVIPQPKAKAFTPIIPIGITIAMFLYETLVMGVMSVPADEPIISDNQNAYEKAKEVVRAAVKLQFVSADRLAKKAQMELGITNNSTTFAIDRSAQWKNFYAKTANMARDLMIPYPVVNIQPRMGYTSGTWYWRFDEANHGSDYKRYQFFLAGDLFGRLDYTRLPNNQGNKVTMYDIYNPQNISGFPLYRDIINNITDIPVPKDSTTNDNGFYEAFTERTGLKVVKVKPTLSNTHIDEILPNSIIVNPPYTAFTARVAATGVPLVYDFEAGKYKDKATGQIYTPLNDESDINWDPPVVKRQVQADGTTKVGTTVINEAGTNTFVDATDVTTQVPPLTNQIPFSWTLQDYAISLPVNENGRKGISVPKGARVGIPVGTIPANVGWAGLDARVNGGTGTVTIEADGTVTGVAEGEVDILVSAKNPAITKTETLTVTVTATAGGGGGITPPAAPSIISIFLDLLRAIVMYLYRLAMFVLTIPAIPAVPLTNTALNFVTNFRLGGTTHSYFSNIIPINVNLLDLIRAMITAIMSFSVYKIVRRFFSG